MKTLLLKPYKIPCACMLSCFSHVQLFAILWIVPHLAPLYMGSLQARILEWVALPSSRGSFQPRDWIQTMQADSLLSEPPGKPKNTEVGSLFLLRGIFPTNNQTGVSCIAGRFFTSWATRETQKYSVHGILQARILEWVAMPFSRGSSQPRDHQTQVFHIASGFFTIWVTHTQN